MAGTINAATGVDTTQRPTTTNRRPSRRTRRVLSVVASLMAVFALSGVLTSCETTDRDRTEVVDLINITRRQHGLPPLDQNPQLTVKADNWAQRMRNSCQISHSRLADGAPSNWQKLGENVGRGGSIFQVHGAYLGSPGHRANILDRSYNQVGAAAVWGRCNGHRTVFTVQVFMRG
jgi:uncharacterized protein YkwD